MKKIGTTTSGSVIVEMTTQEYDAIQQLQVGGSAPSPKAASTPEIAPRMNHSERSSYVAERLKKLSPKKKDGVVRSIEAMFQFGGGIDASEVEKVIATLQKQKFFSITQMAASPTPRASQSWVATADKLPRSLRSASPAPPCLQF